MYGIRVPLGVSLDSPTSEWLWVIDSDQTPLLFQDKAAAIAASIIWKISTVELYKGEDID